jgi:hypothetical protein
MNFIEGHGSGRVGSTGSFIAGTALLFSVACGSPDAVEQPVGVPVDGEVKSAPQGQVIDASEAPKLIQADVVDIRQYVPERPASEIVEKAIKSCLIDFNDSFLISLMPDQAWTTFALSPFYIQNCGDGERWVYTQPLNMDHYHLGFEFQSQYDFCFGTKPKIGQMIGSSCANQKEAKFWPRNAQNMQSGSGIDFYARTYGGTRLNFDLKAIRILQGPAIIKVYRNDIGGWWQWELPAGNWTFPVNSTNLRELQVFHRDFNGIFSIDDVKLDVRY